jgi:hypothetical protein
MNINQNVATNVVAYFPRLISDKLYPIYFPEFYIRYGTSSIFRILEFPPYRFDYLCIKNLLFETG